MSETQTGTPRTDALAREFDEHEHGTARLLFTFARQLERELAEVRKMHADRVQERDHALRDRWKWESELAEAREASAVMQRHMNLARKVAGCADEETLVVTIEKLQSQLPTQRAALEKAREVGWRSLKWLRRIDERRVDIPKSFFGDCDVDPLIVDSREALTAINAALEARS